MPTESISSSETAAVSPGSDVNKSDPPSPGKLKRHPTTEHPDLDHFDKGGDLQRTLSRVATRNSTRTTATQDPTAEGFDYKTHLQHALRKGDREGVLHRELGVAFADLTVTGDGSGLAYGPTVGAILTGITRLGAALRATRHPTRKEILSKFTGSVKPGQMLLVLGRCAAPLIRKVLTPGRR